MNDYDRVIIVEDDLDLRESLVEYLTRIGHGVVGVGNCLDFYRAFAEGPFAVAVIDVGLPDQSGFVLAEFIRKNAMTGVVLLTARDSLADRLLGYGFGADYYLTKPIDCRELAAVIANLKTRLAMAPAVSRSAEGGWRLARHSWRLLSPNGAAVPLTAKEMQFINCLAVRVGRPVRREELFSALDYRDDEYAHRAMDSLVRRLRRKIAAVSEETFPPIKTIHAVGYCFAAPLTLL